MFLRLAGAQRSEGEYYPPEASTCRAQGRQVRQVVRKAHLEKRVARQFAPGGALDSQTSDSQFIAALLDVRRTASDDTGHCSVAIQTDPATSCEDIDAVHPYPVVNASPSAMPMHPRHHCQLALQQLRDALSHFETCCHEQADPQQDLQASEWYDSNFLDLDEQSQTLVDIDMVPRPSQKYTLPAPSHMHDVRRAAKNAN
ncbi:hypothetical protein A0H81_07150 [Grifola frondosa]|uniref:Uncharacterized protein n=1 Tax=Grifola frondosa TaxID=5627 RepID=A0A1C7M8V4_GRIFR|nr:hypothetical protein A0H81_07150 [Grifola frondosa]